MKRSFKFDDLENRLTPSPIYSGLSPIMVDVEPIPQFEIPPISPLDAYFEMLELERLRLEKVRELYEIYVPFEEVISPIIIGPDVPPE